MILENKENKNKLEQASIKQKNLYKEKDKTIKKDKKNTQRFQIYYQNVRGLKSKTDFSAKTIDGYELILICLVETHLTKDGQIPIPGYKIFRNDADILIAIN